jgi:dTDP-4-amino-4,6-dideoxygalactose transaminase
MIPFNKPAITGNEVKYIQDAISRNKLSGDGYYTEQCSELICQKFNFDKVLLTTSCTHALEMAAILIDIGPGDEVIMPSYTFVSTANAFVLRGAKVVFVDVRADNLNIDEKLIEAAITDKTKAIVPVHYSGVPCEMDKIMEIAQKYNLYVVEDAAQAIGSKYKDKYAGGIGHLGTYSFHETKNLNCGEGGALIVNDPKLVDRAEIIREKGTNRKQFFRGEVDKYSWVDIGSSYLISEINAAFLYSQLENLDKINNKRIDVWQRYYEQLKEVCTTQTININGHLFYILMDSAEQRVDFLNKAKNAGILFTSHYVPLHSSQEGTKVTNFFGKDNYTTNLANRLIRLPLFFSITNDEVERVIQFVKDFFKR